MLRGRHGVIASSPWNNDSGCPRHQHPDFRPAESAKTAFAGISDDHPGADTQLCVSENIYAEYEEVIRRPRFNRSDGEIEATLRTIRDKGFWVKPTEKVRACSDPDDVI